MSSTFTSGAVVVLAAVYITYMFFTVTIPGLKAGEVRSRKTSYRRDDEPISFWFTVIIVTFAMLALWISSAMYAWIMLFRD